MKHLVLLRGVNVSGQKIIKMETHRAALFKSGFEDVTTYIQSGNIMLQSTLNASNVSEKVKSVIKAEFGFDVPSVATSLPELEKIVKSNPFNVDFANTYVAYFDREPENELKTAWNNSDHGNDKTYLGNKTMYVRYDESAGKSKLTNAVIEKKLSVTSTMRNWNTTLKLLELLKTK